MRHQKQPKLAFSAVEHGVVFLRLMPVLNRRRTHYGDPSHSDALPETAQPINMAMRLEILILVAAILIQLFYVHIYELFISLKGQSPAKPRADIIEVSEFHSSNCEGPPARVWLIRPGPPGHSEDAPCISIRPEMKVPGQAAGTAGAAAVEQLYGRVSCDTLRHEEGGFLDLCGSAWY